MTCETLDETLPILFNSSSFRKKKFRLNRRYIFVRIVVASLLFFYIFLLSFFYLHQCSCVHRKSLYKDISLRDEEDFLRDVLFIYRCTKIQESRIKNIQYSFKDVEFQRTKLKFYLYLILKKSRLSKQNFILYCRICFRKFINQIYFKYTSLILCLLSCLKNFSNYSISVSKMRYFCSILGSRNHATKTCYDAQDTNYQIYI